MARVNYILGAGASANTIPVVKNIGWEIQFIINEINSPEFEQNLKRYDALKYPFNQIVDLLNEDLTWMLSKENDHSTIDTYAKKLWIQEDYHNLNRLKIAFSFFLNVLQGIRGVDKRYDYFLAALLEDNGLFSSDVNIVSWNYDNQLELAYSEYKRVDYMNECASQLSLTLKNSRRSKITQGQFNFMKVNGSTSVYDEMGFRTYYFLPLVKYADRSQMWCEAMNMYINLRESEASLSALSFAWEQGGVDSEYFEEVSKTFTDTEVLVIIGYSFPFFNRLIDRKILEKAVNLKKIYIQDTHPENIIDKIKESLPKNLQLPEGSIQEIRNVEEFIVPHEL